MTGMNPMQMVRQITGAQNPMQMMMQLSQHNPALDQAMQMMNGKTPDQMRQMVNNMARQRGVDLNQLARQMGIRFPG